MEHAYNSGCMRTHGHQIQLDGGKGGGHKKTKQKKKLYRLFIRASNEPEASLESLQQRLLHSEPREMPKYNAFIRFENSILNYF